MRQVISPNQTVLWTRYELAELYGPMTPTKTAHVLVKPRPVMTLQNPRGLRALIQRVIVGVEKACRKVLWGVSPRRFGGLASG